MVDSLNLPVLDLSMMEDNSGEKPEGSPREAMKNLVEVEYEAEGGRNEVLGQFDLSAFLDDEGNGESSGLLTEESEVPGDLMVSSALVPLEKQKMNDELKKDEFILINNDDLRDFVVSTRNPNTVRKTNQVVKTFQKWLEEVCMDYRLIEEIEPAELDAFMSNYLLTKRKSSGEEHQPDTLTGIHRAILRYLKDKGYPVDPLTSKEFGLSREVLASKRIKLKQEGLGNRPNKAESFDEEEINQMWETGALGSGDPKVLQHTVFFYLALGFGFRGCDESKKLKWGDVILHQDKDNLEYLEFRERTTKTRNGAQGGHVRPFAPKIYATGDDRCPVWHYKLYASKRPDKSLHTESPFYLTVRQGAETRDDIPFYIASPMGINKLREIVKEICSKAGIVGRHTNHSLRKTTCQTLMSNNVPPVLVAQLSGHKSLASLQNYSTATKPQQREMSNILVKTGNKRGLTDDSFVAPKRKSIEGQFVPNRTSHGLMQLPPAPQAVRLPSAAAGVAPQPGSVGETGPLSTMMREASGLLSGANVTGNITLNFNYNLQTNQSSQVNMSPKAPLPANDD